MTWFPRLLGIGTAAFGGVVVRRPELVARACGLVNSEGRTPSGTAAVIRCIGARDVASGLAMTFARGADRLRLASVVRAASDFGDAVLLDRLPHGTNARRRVATLAAARGLLCALGGLTVRSNEGEPVEAAEARSPRWCGSARGGIRREERSSPLRRWVSGIVDDELREKSLID